MITVTVPLKLWTSEHGTWHFLNVPDEQSGEIHAHCLAMLRGFKSARVEATINGVTWRTSVFPMKSGGYILPVKKDVRRKAGIAAYDEVTVTLELL